MIITILKVFASFFLVIVIAHKEAYAELHNALSKHHEIPLRIVNGTDAKEGEFPYMVQLRDEYEMFNCGGSIIGDKWILTAGHCVYKTTIKSIVYGTNILYQYNDTTDTIIEVKKMYYHPKFYYNLTAVGANPVYDIGILELAEPIPFSDKVQPIKLVDDDAVPFHVDGVLSGWGVNKSEGLAMPCLQKITLQFLNDQECTQRIYDYCGYKVFNSTYNLCTDNHWDGSCNGDSGSPFVINGIQYGIVSWSLKPCGSNPGTYSRLTNPEYRDYIRSVTGV